MNTVLFDKVLPKYLNSSTFLQDLNQS